MFILNFSGNFKHFKKLIGWTNHNLITILIGLEGVRTSKVLKEDCLDAKWEPKNLEQSVSMSRRFARNACLAWSIDALDAYLGYLKKKPFYFDDIELEAKFSNLEINRSVYNMLNVVTDFCGYKNDIFLSIVHLGIQWRNRLIHYHADNKLDEEYFDLLAQINSDDLKKEDFKGIIISEMLERFEKKESPRLKEVATIIRCIHHFVYEIDKILIKRINLVQYCNHLFKLDEIAFANIKLPEPGKQKKRVTEFLLNNGFIETNDESHQNILTYNDLEEMLQTKL